MNGAGVLVTGAAGFVGGHVARALAESGYEVRGLSRRPVKPSPGDPPIEWTIGDLRNADDRRRAVAGVAGIVHCAGWVSLGRDPRGEGQAVNVEATSALLDEAVASGVERFVYTSTLWTVAGGTAEEPASEDSAWNLESLRGPYCDSKRAAERLVLGRDGDGLRTIVLCPGLVIGRRDERPTSTLVLLEMAKYPLIALAGGGIPVVDARIAARAHVRALEGSAAFGRRYVVAGPYLSYPAMAALVHRVAGRPGRVVPLPDWSEGLLTRWVGWLERPGIRLAPGMTASAVAGGFRRLHVRGSRADAAFGLVHPPPIASIFEALEDHRRSGRAPWLRLKEPDGVRWAEAHEPVRHESGVV